MIASFALLSVAHAGFDVSSYRKEDKLGKTYWAAASALDSKLETCWQVDPEQQNVGSWIELDVPAGEVDKLGVVIGWAKDDKTFGDYARIKSAKVEILDAGSGTPTVVATTNVTFEDKNGWQVVELPDTKVGGEVLGGKVKLTVTEVYPGRDFPSLAVSEVRVHMKEFPAASMAFATPFDSETPANKAAMATDNNAKTFWAATSPTATFALKAPGYGLASVGIQSGPKAFARPKTIQITANQATTTQVLPDAPGVMQWVLLPCLVGYTGGAWGDVQVKIVDSYPGDVAANGVAIAELKLNAGSIEEF
jgi:hypothetical protein